MTNNNEINFELLKRKIIETGLDTDSYEFAKKCGGRIAPMLCGKIVSGELCSSSEASFRKLYPGIDNLIEKILNF